MISKYLIILSLTLIGLVAISREPTQDKKDTITVLHPEEKINSIKYKDNKVDEKVERIEFKNAELKNVVEILSEISGVNIVTTAKAGSKRVSLFLQDVSVKAAIDTVSRSSGLWYRYNQDTNVYIIMTTEEYSKDIVVFRDEETNTYNLKHHNVFAAADAIKALYGPRVEISHPMNEGTYKIENKTGDDFQVAGTGTVAEIKNTSESPMTSGLTTSQISSIGQEQSMIEKINIDHIAAISQQDKEPIRITYNLLHNMLFIRSSDKEALNSIKTFVTELDKPAKQVLMQLKVVKILHDDTNKSVFDYKSTSGITQINTDIDASNILGSTGSSVNGIKAVQAGLGNFPALTGSTLALQFLSDSVLAKIQLLQSEGKTETISSPMILSSNNKSSEIFIGEERVMVTDIEVNTSTSDGIASKSFDPVTEMKKIGNRLTIWPRINGDKTVTLDIDQEISTLLKESQSLPTSETDTFEIDSINESTLKLTMIAEHGKPVVIGGIISTDLKDDSKKVPLLGDIPVLGKLFRSDSDVSTRTEMVLIITPYIMDSVNDIESVNKMLIGKDIKSTAVKQNLQNRYVDNKYIYELSSKNKRTVSMISEAAKLTHTAIENNNITKQKPWLLSADITVVPILSLHENNQHITAVKVINNKNKTLKLSYDSLLNIWDSVAYEKNNIKGSGYIIAYLISDIPFSNMVSGK